MNGASPDEKVIFNAARRIASPDGRARYVRHACGDDAGLRAQVEALLRVYDRDTTFLGEPALVPRPASRLAPGEWVGAYRLGRQLGAGGMGVVFEADQAHPVRRRVALKVARPGLDAHHFLARFEAERQALALMDHPNIATVLDAGTTDDGRPFFVMELVLGAPVTDHCDEARLDVRGRLGLFVTVCRAVQHAHQKGVIHRDLKPSNVLVALYDGEPVPKVIDFGVAKATGRKLTASTLVTQLGLLVGTPEYMSPEQADPGQLDIDTRADVYALGVLLYELLTGTPPLRRGHPTDGLLDFLRAVREDEPPRPSARLADARAARVVRGDLDRVVMKALEKDRDRRYDSAAALAADVERFLNHEPVSAGAPTALARVRKFVRRNRAAVTAAGLVLLALVAGVAGTTAGLVEARRQAALARASADAEADERRRADDEAAVAREVNAILTEALAGQADPTAQAAAGRAPDPDLKVRTLLDGVAARLDGRFTGRPAVEAAVRRTVGRAYQELGVYPDAVRHLERALALARQTGDPVDVAADLAVAYRRAGQLDAAGRLNREFLDLLAPTRGPDDPHVLTFGYNLGLVAFAQGHPDDAEPRLTAALAGRERAHGPDSFPAAQARTALGLVANERKDYDRALRLHTDALAVYRRVLSDDAPATLIVRHNRADTLNRAGRTADAVAEYEALVAAARRTLGPRHVDTLTYLHGLALCHHDLGRLDRAEPLYREAADGARATLPAAHPDVASYGYDLGCLYQDAGRLAEADRELEAALGVSRQAHPPGHALTERILQHLIDVRFAADRPADAEPLVRELLGQYEAGRPGHWITAHLRGLLGGVLVARGRYAEAEPHLLAGHRGLSAQLPTIPPAARGKYVELLDRLAELYTRRGQPTESARWRAERAKYPPPVAPTPRPAR